MRLGRLLGVALLCSPVGHAALAASKPHRKTAQDSLLTPLVPPPPAAAPETPQVTPAPTPLVPDTPEPQARSPQLERDAYPLELRVHRDERDLHLLLVPKVGVVMPQVLGKLGASLAGALEITYVSAAIEGRLAAEVEFSYSQPNYSNSFSDARLPGGSVAYTLNEKTFGIYLGPKYLFFPITRTVVPYVSIGARLQLLRSDSAASSPSGQGFGSVNETGTHLGLGGQAGLAFQVGPGHLGIEFQLASSSINHAVTGSANVGGLEGRFGYIVKL